MKRFIAIVIVLVIAGWLLWDQLTGLTAPIADVVGMTNPRQDFIEITDSEGRELTCKLTAKHHGFIQIEREADARVFFVSLSRLSLLSSQRLKLVPDFNEEVIETELLKQAENAIQPELLYVRELCTFRCPRNGQIMDTEHGMLRDAYRDYLNQSGIRYREVALDVQPASDGGYYLPLGIKDAPCIRVGEEIIYKRDEKKIRQAIIDQYMARLD